MNAYGPLLTEYYRTHEGVKGDCVFPHVCSEGHFGTEGYVVCCDSLSQLSLGILMTACMHTWVGQFKVPRVQHSLSRIMLLMSTHKVRQREISVMTIDGQECVTNVKESSRWGWGKPTCQRGNGPTAFQVG